MTTLVTVVTPSYNQAAYLEQTIQSVLAQDYPAIEYLVVDGASTDNSVEIIRRCQTARPDRLTWWVSEPDRGQAEGINKGLRRASGEIVAWLNSDDLYLPGAVARGVAALEKDPELGMVFGDALTIDPSGHPLGRLAFGDWGLEQFLRFRIICQPAVFMRRSVLEKASLLDPAYHMMLDHHLWLRMARLAPVHYIGSPDPSEFLPLAAARHHPAAKNVAQPARFAQETLRLLEWMQSQPDLAERIARSPRQVRGGAYRLAARYYLDGGQPAQALASYARALAAWPSYAARHAHRMAYAAAALVRLDGLLDRLRKPGVERTRRALAARLKKASFPGYTGPSSLQGWPGINLDIE
jgi:hypothetical protein